MRRSSSSLLRTASCQSRCTCTFPQVGSSSASGPKSRSLTSSSKARQLDATERDALYHKPILRPPKLDLSAKATVTKEELDTIYSTLAVTPISAYSALAHRIYGLGEELTLNLQLVEQCCCCPSFWNQVKRSTYLESWQAVNKIPNKELKSTKYTNFLDDERLDNQELADLGNEILGLFATEWVENRWPHLPSKLVQFQCLCVLKSLVFPLS